jgi:hypothetical protein
MALAEKGLFSYYEQTSAPLPNYLKSTPRQWLGNYNLEKEAYQHFEEHGYPLTLAVKNNDRFQITIDFTQPTAKTELWKNYDWSKLAPNTIFSPRRIAISSQLFWEAPLDKMFDYQMLWRDKTKKFRNDMERAVALYVSTHGTTLHETVNRIVFNASPQETTDTLIYKQNVRKFLMTAFYELRRNNQIVAADKLALQTASMLRGNVKEAIEVICDFYNPPHTADPENWFYFWFESFIDFIFNKSIKL